MKKITFIISMTALLISLINLYNGMTGLGGGLRRRAETPEKSE